MGSLDAEIRSKPALSIETVAQPFEITLMGIFYTQNAWKRMILFGYMKFDMAASRHVFTKDNKKQAVSRVLDNAAYDADFKVLLVGSILIATGAIFTDSIPVLIASMIIAPLASPVLALGIGIVMRDLRVSMRALAVLGASCVIAVLIAGIVTFCFDENLIRDTYISFGGNRFAAIGIAVVAGCIGAYGMLSTKVAPAITGVAIAVSLMPPLVATSINFVVGNYGLALEAGILFLLNVVGILFASIIVFWKYGIGREYRP